MLIQLVKFLLEITDVHWGIYALIDQIDVVYNRFLVHTRVFAQNSTSFCPSILLANFQTFFGRVKVLLKISLNFLHN